MHIVFLLYLRMCSEKLFIEPTYLSFCYFSKKNSDKKVLYAMLSYLQKRTIFKLRILEIVSKQFGKISDSYYKNFSFFTSMRVILDSEKNA